MPSITRTTRTREATAQLDELADPLERALDPAERRALGAHFTPPEHVERLVQWTVEEPLRADLEAARANVRRLARAGAMAEARDQAASALRAVCAVKILDPACGTGNLLVGSLGALMRVEREARALVEEAGAADLCEGVAVTLAQLLGIELTQRAREIAERTLWIAFAQARIREGQPTPEAPSVMRPMPETRPMIEVRDALITWEGDEARESPWPEADFIVGNPPFMGSSRMRSTLGQTHVAALRRAYRSVPDGSDLVMYWWSRAAALVRGRAVRRFGMITTNSISQALNRRVVEAHLASGELTLAFAVPDHPWVDEANGAAVRIAMTVGERTESGAAGPSTVGTLGRVVDERAGEAPGSVTGLVRLSFERGRIHADLTIGPTTAEAARLRANEGVASPGVKLHGAGFIVTEAQAKALGLGRIPGLARHIRPYRNGRDLTQSARGAYVIDLDGLTEAEVLARYPSVHAWLAARVKPERERNAEPYRRENWWLFGRRNTELRRALAGLTRFVATPETSKHRFFTFLDASILPDNMLVNIGLDDAFYLAVLSSRAHEVWALAAGGRLGLGNDPRYTKTRCFDAFPFPECGDAERRTLRELGEALDARRKQWLDERPGRSMTGLYNAMTSGGQRRGGRGRSPSVAAALDIDPAAISAIGRLHDEVDAATLGVVGLPSDSSDERILTVLLSLNAERAAEEQRGRVRWLRPELQAESRVDVDEKTQAA